MKSIRWIQIWRYRGLSQSNNSTWVSSKQCQTFQIIAAVSSKFEKHRADHTLTHWSRNQWWRLTIYPQGSTFRQDSLGMWQHWLWRRVWSIQSKVEWSNQITAWQMCNQEPPIDQLKVIHNKTEYKCIENLVRTQTKPEIIQIICMALQVIRQLFHQRPMQLPNQTAL